MAFSIPPISTEDASYFRNRTVEQTLGDIAHKLDCVFNQFNIIKGLVRKVDKPTTIKEDQEVVIKHLENEVRKCVEGIQDFNERLRKLERYQEGQTAVVKEVKDGKLLYTTSITADGGTLISRGNL